MINGTTKENITEQVEQEQVKRQVDESLTRKVELLPNEDAYMASLVAAINKKR